MALLTEICICWAIKKTRFCIVFPDCVEVLIRLINSRSAAGINKKMSQIIQSGISFPMHPAEEAVLVRVQWLEEDESILQ